MTILLTICGTWELIIYGTGEFTILLTINDTGEFTILLTIYGTGELTILTIIILIIYIYCTGARELIILWTI